MVGKGSTSSIPTGAAPPPSPPDPNIGFCLVLSGPFPTCLRGPFYSGMRGHHVGSRFLWRPFRLERSSLVGLGHCAWPLRASLGPNPPGVAGSAPPPLPPVLAEAFTRVVGTGGSPGLRSAAQLNALQARVLRTAAVENQSVVALGPPYSGKTLAYGLPVLAQTARTLWLEARSGVGGGGNFAGFPLGLGLDLARPPLAGYPCVRPGGTPLALVLAPTGLLAQQIASVLTTMVGAVPDPVAPVVSLLVSARRPAVVTTLPRHHPQMDGGEGGSSGLASRLPGRTDIVVATPGALLAHTNPLRTYALAAMAHGQRAYPGSWRFLEALGRLGPGEGAGGEGWHLTPIAAVNRAVGLAVLATLREWSHSPPGLGQLSRTLSVADGPKTAAAERICTDRDLARFRTRLDPRGQLFESASLTLGAGLGAVPELCGEGLSLAYVQLVVLDEYDEFASGEAAPGLLALHRQLVHPKRAARLAQAAADAEDRAFLLSAQGQAWLACRTGTASGPSMTLGRTPNLGERADGARAVLAALASLGLGPISNTPPTAPNPGQDRSARALSKSRARILLTALRRAGSWAHLVTPTKSHGIPQVICVGATEPTAEGYAVLARFAPSARHIAADDGPSQFQQGLQPILQPKTRTKTKSKPKTGPEPDGTTSQAPALHRILDVHPMRKQALLVQLFRRRPARSPGGIGGIAPDARVIIFVRTVQRANRLAEALQSVVLPRSTASRDGRPGHGHDPKRKQTCRGQPAVTVLVGDLSPSQRRRRLAQFTDGPARVLIATDLASRGLDVPNIQWIINYDVPPSPQIYRHRAGRAGRGPAPSGRCRVITFVGSVPQMLVLRGQPVDLNEDYLATTLLNTLTPKLFPGLRRFPSAACIGAWRDNPAPRKRHRNVSVGSSDNAQQGGADLEAQILRIRRRHRRRLASTRKVLMFSPRALHPLRAQTLQRLALSRTSNRLRAADPWSRSPAAALERRVLAQRAQRLAVESTQPASRGTPTLAAYPAGRYEAVLERVRAARIARHQPSHPSRGAARRTGANRARSANTGQSQPLPSRRQSKRSR